MSLGELCWVLFLAGLPFAHLLDRRVDIWHGQNLWAHGWLGIVFALSLLSSRKATQNKPLTAWFVWIVLLTSFLWRETIATQKTYPLPLLMAFCHCLSIVLFYAAATAMWTPALLSRLLTWMARAAAVVAGYGVIQLLSFDQIFNNIDAPGGRDILVGTIGNPSHFSAVLAFSLPILLLQKGKQWWVPTLTTCALLAYLGLKQHSVGGLAAAMVGLLVFTFFRAKKVFAGLCVLSVLIVAYFCYDRSFLNPSGRFFVWQHFYGLLERKGITGFGPGAVMQMSHSITEGPLWKWRHVHNEYLQLAIEQGVIGLGLVGWGLWDVAGRFLKAPKTPQAVCLAAVLAAFLMNSLVNFPAHLWQLGVFGLVAYSGLYLQEA